MTKFKGSLYRVTAHHTYQVPVTLKAQPYVIDLDWIQSAENSLVKWHTLMGPGFAHIVGEQDYHHTGTWRSRALSTG